jgi:hypothetical protein
MTALARCNRFLGSPNRVFMFLSTRSVFIRRLSLVVGFIAAGYRFFDLQKSWSIGGPPAQDATHPMRTLVINVSNTLLECGLFFLAAWAVVRITAWVISGISSDRAQERTKAINEEYDVLSDPVKRANCDWQYARQPSSAAAPPPRPPASASPSPGPPPLTTRRPDETASRRSTTGLCWSPFTVLAFLLLFVAAAVLAYLSAQVSENAPGGILLFDLMFFAPPFAIGMAIARRTVAWIVIASIATIIWFGWLVLLSFTSASLADPDASARGLQAIACAIAFFMIAIVNACIRRTRGWIAAATVAMVLFLVAVVPMVLGLFMIQSVKRQQAALIRNKPGDITFALRESASRVVEPLVQSGISGDEARRIAILDMPSTANTNLWTGLRARLNPKQKEVVISALFEYHLLTHPATDNFLDVFLSEQAICDMLYADTPMTMGKIFDVWRAGLCNQSEDWWESQLRDMPLPKQQEFKHLRTRLTDAEAKGATTSTVPPAKVTIKQGDDGVKRILGDDGTWQPLP